MATFYVGNSPEEAFDKILKGGAETGSVKSGSSTSSFNPVRKDADISIDPDFLDKDRDWLDSSRILYSATQGKQFQGSDKELADWGLDRMARFNYNLPLQGVDAVRVAGMSLDAKKAFLYMLDTFQENVEMSGQGALTAAKYMVADPTNWVSLASLGLASVGSTATKIASREALRSALRAGIAGGIEGGLYGGATTYLEEKARVNAGGKTEVDTGRVAGGAAIGSVLGFGLGGLIDVGATGLRKAPTEVPAQAATSDAPAVSPQAVPEQQLGFDFGGRSDPQSRLPDMPQEQLMLPMDSPTINVKPVESILEWKQRYTPVDQPAVDLAEVYAREQKLREAGELPPTPTMNQPGQLGMDLAQPNGPISYDGQGSLFPTQPELFGTVQAVGRDADGGLLQSAAGDVLVRENAGATRFVGDAVTETPQAAAPRTRRERVPVTPSEATREVVRDVVDEALPVSAVIDAVKAAGKDIPRLLTKTDEIEAAIAPIVNVIRKLDIKAGEKLQDVMTRLGMSDTERQALDLSVIGAEADVGNALKNLIIARDSATDKGMRAAFDKEIRAINEVFNPLQSYAREVKRGFGGNLGALSRIDNPLKGTAIDATPDNLLRDKGIDPAIATTRQREAAEREFVSILNKTADFRKTDVEIAKMDALYKAAVDAGDTEEAVRLLAKMQQAEAAKLAEEAAETIGDGLFKKLGTGVNGAIRFLNEYVIATVLGPSSTLVNGLTGFVQIAYKPLMNYIAKGPLDRAAAREMLTTYGAMWHMKSQAFQAAKKAFKLERNLLSNDAGRWLEGQGPAIPGAAGGALRVWLRVLSSTDEFFQQMAYRGYIEGQATYQAMQFAAEKGLSKADTNKLVKEAIDNAVNSAYTATKPDTDTIALLYQKGAERGYTGDKLIKFIKSELDNPEVFRRAENQAGKTYTDDLLFKREFSQSPDSRLLGLPISQWAAGYENLVQKQPIIRLMGQLFFRTPVRVFEEGIRLTPGLQLMAPNFISDLKNMNGDVRRVRAMGEALAAYGFGTSVIMAYAAGNITGGGPDDYKARRRVEDGKQWEPYSIRVGDRYISYRNLDPFATPIKIFVNALERLENLEYRRSQGEFINKTEMQQTLGYLSVGITATAQAIRDANLAEGIDQLAKFGEAIVDPSKNEKALERFLGEKAALLIPNVVSKAQKSFSEGGNVMNDPIAMEQFWKAKINPTDPTVTKQFDAFGFERTVNSTGMLSFLGINTSTDEQREKGIPADLLEARRRLAAITVATGITFTRAHTTDLPGFKGLDLRTEMTADGKTTVYNKAMEYYQNSGAYKAALAVMKATEGMPVGSKTYNDGGTQAGAIENILQAYWKKSLERVHMEDVNAQRRRSQATEFKIETLTGQREVGNLPFRPL